LAEFKPLAEQGNITAQDLLSSKCSQGEGIIQDNIYARIWANIASANGDEQARGLKMVKQLLVNASYTND
jgi:hypothetical protein|tara:strand:+ start:569 stop:778 length:210 start_codon:yes stop_codon:yes gene_type:complete